MRRKILCGMLCAGLIAAVLTGCGKSSENETKKTTETETVADIETSDAETETAETEEDDTKDPDKISYQEYAAEEIQADMYSDLDAAAKKYADQYVAITGILEEAEANENFVPVAKIVRLKTTAESTDSNENTYVEITAYAWDDEWLTLDDYKNAIADMQPGDEVILRGYIGSEDQGAFSSDGPYRGCTVDLIDIKKK